MPSWTFRMARNISIHGREWTGAKLAYWSRPLHDGSRLPTLSGISKERRRGAEMTYRLNEYHNPPATETNERVLGNILVRTSQVLQTGDHPNLAQTLLRRLSLLSNVGSCWSLEPWNQSRKGSVLGRDYARPGACSRALHRPRLRIGILASNTGHRRPHPFGLASCLLSF